MTVVKDTIQYLKDSGKLPEKRLEGKDYKPLPSNKKQSKVARQHLPI